MTTPESEPRSNQTDPTLQIIRSEFALGTSGDHVFGEEPIASPRRQSGTDEERNRMIVSFDEGGVHVDFEEADGTRHP